MAIAHQSETLGVANTTAGNYNTTVNPAAAPDAVCVIIIAGSTTDLVTSVNYGGVDLKRLRFNTEATEAGGVYVYWGKGPMPAGSQTAQIVRTGTTNLRAVWYTMTCASGQDIAVNIHGTGTSASVANPSWTIATTAATNTVCYEGIHSGLTTMTSTPASGWTLSTSEDLGAFGRGWARRAFTGGSLTCGWTAATANNFVGCSVAFREVPETTRVAPTFPDAADLVEGTGTRNFAAVTTSAGDYLVVGANGEDGLSLTNITPSCTGLTFTLGANAGASGDSRVQIWTAPDAAGGSRTVTMTPSGGGFQYRSRLTVVRGSDGPGGSGTSITAATVSVTRTQDNSAMFIGVGDWSTGPVGSPAWAPAGGITTASQQGTQGTYIFGRWDDSGAAATELHGITTPSYTTPSVAVLEMLGQAAGGGTAPVGATDLATSWRVLTQVTSDLATSWRVAARVTSDLVTSWRVFAPVAPTTLVTSWRVFTPVAGSDLTTSWRVQARVTADLATSWRVATAVGPADLVTSWLVYELAGPTDLATSWRVLSSLVTVTSDLVTSWRVAARVTSDLTTTWRVYAPVTADLATSWRVFAAVSPADLATSWRVLQAVVPVSPTNLATSWKVYAPVPVVDLATSWRVLILPIVIRPFTGTTARPGTGTTTRPSTGTTSRPSTGTITRPNTGTITRP